MSPRPMLILASAALAAVLSGAAAISDTRPAMPIERASQLSRVIHDAQSIPAASHRRAVTTAACSPRGEGCSNSNDCCEGQCDHDACQ